MAIGGNNDGALVCMGIRLTYADWVLFLLQERQELSGTVNEARLYSVSTLLLGVLGILAFSIVVSKRLARHVAHLDQEKQLMNEQLIRAGKLASLGEMAAGIAHEINNPVGIMIQEAGWIQDLLDEAEQGVGDNMDEFREAARKIQLHGKRCRDITHKLLRFARGAPPALEQVQLNQLIEDVIALCQQRARLSGVEINRSLAEDMPEVNVTPSEVQQVLVNLINNSLDAMEEAGRMIEIISKTRGNYAAVDVGDTGPGISQRDIGRIFDPFFTTKPVGKGTGLGLSICYGIMKKMKGDITVTSTEGQGTTFHLLFPLAAEGR
jgi:two-component system NtrC family sensor kinase